jgi:hypothetical protein
MRATDIARAMVTEFGMTDALGVVSYDGHRQQAFIENPFGRERGNYAEETALRIDNEIKRILTDAHEKARQILRDHRQYRPPVGAPPREGSHRSRRAKAIMGAPVPSAEGSGSAAGWSTERIIPGRVSRRPERQRRGLPIDDFALDRRAPAPPRPVRTPPHGASQKTHGGVDLPDAGWRGHARSSAGTPDRIGRIDILDVGGRPVDVADEVGRDAWVVADRSGRQGTGEPVLVGQRPKVRYGPETKGCLR